MKAVLPQTQFKLYLDASVTIELAIGLNSSSKSSSICSVY